MTDFSTNIQELSESLTKLQPDEDNSITSLLSILDSMDEEFLALSQIDVPKEFFANEELSDEAYTYMHEAVAKYHEYYENDVPDDNTLLIANTSYARAMKRIEYISSILKGEVPTGEGIEVTTEDAYDFTPVTDDTIDYDE